MTFSYTNELGVAGRTATLSIPSAMGAGRALQATLQAGDKGVRSVESCTSSATPAGSGTFNVVLLKQHAHLNLIASVGADYDWQYIGLPEIPDSACLFLLVMAVTASGNMAGAIDLIQV